MALAVLLSGMLMYAALYAPIPLLPSLERLFGSGVGSSGLGVSLPLIALVILSPFVAKIPFPVGKLLGSGLLLMGLCGVLGALAPSMEWWIAARAMQGVFAAFVPSLSLALLPSLFSEHSSKMAGYWVAGNVLGGGLGRFLGGVLGDAWGERAALAALSIPVMILAVFVWQSSKTLQLPKTEYNFGAWRLYVLGFVLLFVNLFVANLMPYHLEALGFSKAHIGYVMLAYLAGIPGSSVAGRLQQRWGIVRAVQGAFVLVMLGLGVQSLGSGVAMVSGFVIMMAGLFTAQGLVSGVSAKGGSGVSGTYIAAFYLGGTLAGLVYPPFVHWGLAWEILLGLGLCVVVLYLSPRALNITVQRS